MFLDNNFKLPSGLWPVMLTPFEDDGSIDLKSLDSLTEFYIESGSAGLFVNCLSSEMYSLTPIERVELTKRVVEIVDGRIPVISTGTFEREVEKQVEYINKISSTGADVVIVITSIISDQNEDDKDLLKKLKFLSSETENIPLGIYECPVPYKRLITPEIMRWVASSGRFFYHKDTSCDLNNIKSKLEVIDQSSRLGFYNANLTTGLDSIQLGADGLSPISANFYPELFNYLLENFQLEEKDTEIEYLQRLLILMDAVIHKDIYPLAAKLFLRRRGLPINAKVRIGPKKLNYEEEKLLDILYQTFEEIHENLKIAQ